MNIHHGLEQVDLENVVLTIGNFDGVHRGHQAILEAGRRRAESAGTQLVAMTFEPHPATVLAPDRVPARLTPIDEKLRLLKAHGASSTVIVKSEARFFDIEADAFLRTWVLPRFRPMAMVEGASFRYGHHQAGNVETLIAAGTALGFEVEIVEPIRVGLGGTPGTVISSSLIRHLIRSGTVDQAAMCLGRPYALIGEVIKGAGRGRTIGIPTANLRIEDQLVPAEGVYAGIATFDAQRLAAAVSIGKTPTFGAGALAVEAHLVGFDPDLYGKTVRIELLEWIRSQQQFDGKDALVAQINRDIEHTAAVFQQAQTP